MRTNEDKLTKTIDRSRRGSSNGSIRPSATKTRRTSARRSRTFASPAIVSTRIAKNADELIKDSRSTLKTMNDSLLKLDRVLTDIQKATKPLADRSDSIVKNVDESTDKLNRVLGDLVRPP